MSKPIKPEKKLFGFILPTIESLKEMIGLGKKSSKITQELPQQKATVPKRTIQSTIQQAKDAALTAKESIKKQADNLTKPKETSESDPQEKAETPKSSFQATIQQAKDAALAAKESIKKQADSLVAPKTDNLPSSDGVVKKESLLERSKRAYEQAQQQVKDKVSKQMKGKDLSSFTPDQEKYKDMAKEGFKKTIGMFKDKIGKKDAESKEPKSSEDQSKISSDDPKNKV